MSRFLTTYNIIPTSTPGAVGSVICACHVMCVLAVCMKWIVACLVARSGRLDADSTGLLIFTQDGTLARDIIGAGRSVCWSILLYSIALRLQCFQLAEHCIGSCEHHHNKPSQPKSRRGFALLACINYKYAGWLIAFCVCCVTKSNGTARSRKNMSYRFARRCWTQKNAR